MGFKNKIVDKGELKYSKKGIFNLSSLYYSGKDWFKAKGYSFVEKGYEDSIKDNKKTTNIAWEAEKEIDDYSKSTINLKISIKDYESTMQDNKRLAKGDLNIAFESKLETDYQDQWQGSLIQQMIRKIHDLFTNKNKIEEYQEIVKKDTHGIYDFLKNLLDEKKPKN